MTKLTREVDERGHKLHVDNFFSSPALSDDLTKKKNKLLRDAGL
jgi:hypothetical protein